MDIRGIVHVPGISAGKDDDGRNAACATCREHSTIALA
jgi:hypothetical protein